MKENTSDFTVTDAQLSEADKLVDTRFSEMIGQTQAKRRYKNILLGMLCEGGFMVPSLIVAPPGIGKSFMLQAVKELVKALSVLVDKERKNLFFKSGKEMETPLAFFTKCMIPHIHDTDSVLYVDEAHEARKGVLSLLRDCLEPDVKRSSKLVRLGDEGEVFYNPNRNSMVLATNEIDMLPYPLITRLERIDLALYSDDEIEQILFKALKDSGIRFDDGTIRKISQCNRGTARDMVSWCNAIRRHIAIRQKKTVNKDDVAEIIRQRETLPLGVTLRELQTLLLLERHGELQLNDIASKNQCESKEQRTFESYLKNRGLMIVESRRRLTQAGRDYLNELRDDNFIDKAILVHDSGVQVS